MRCTVTGVGREMVQDLEGSQLRTRRLAILNLRYPVRHDHAVQALIVSTRQVVRHASCIDVAHVRKELVSRSVNTVDLSCPSVGLPRYISLALVNDRYSVIRVRGEVCLEICCTQKDEIGLLRRSRCIDRISFRALNRRRNCALLLHRPQVVDCHVDGPRSILLCIRREDLVLALKICGI